MSKWIPKRDSTLPLYYKEKPIGPQSHHKMRPRRRGILRLLVLCLSVYTVYYICTLVSKGGHSRASDASEPLNSDISWSDRRDAVKQAFVDSWDDYTRHGWGKDVYHPVKQTAKNMGPAPLGWMIVDSLDTLQIMGLTKQYKAARGFVQNQLNYETVDTEVNVFETTIRMVGGLLSAYYLSDGDELFLKRATQLTDRLMPAFSTGSGIPYAGVNLQTGQTFSPPNDLASVSEVATLQLEYKYLSYLTGDKTYWNVGEKIMARLDNNHPKDGLAPIFVDPQKGTYRGYLIRLGSRGDSYYEYLLKQYLQTNEEIYKEMYLDAYSGIHEHMLAHSEPNKLTFLGELPDGIGGKFDPKMDELVCFIGGLFALGATDGIPVSKIEKLGPKNLEQLEIGKEIGHTCYEMFHQQTTGLAPEIVVFNQDNTRSKDFYIRKNDRHNLQRPETVETLYYLWKLTGDIKYREWGWEIFQNWIKYARVPAGNGKDDAVRYTCLKDVTVDPPVMKDNLESFWFAETLKYLYLLFDDESNSKMDLEHIVFNTEAHPLPRFDIRKTQFSTGWEREKPTSLSGSKNVNKESHNAGWKDPDVIQARKSEAVLDKALADVPDEGPAEEADVKAKKKAPSKLSELRDKANEQIEKLNKQLREEKLDPEEKVGPAKADTNLKLDLSKGKDAMLNELPVVEDKIDEKKAALNDKKKAVEDKALKHKDAVAKDAKLDLKKISDKLAEIEKAGEVEIADAKAGAKAKAGAAKAGLAEEKVKLEQDKEEFVEKSKKVAEQLKEGGKLPHAKPVADPLDAQAEEIMAQ